MNTIKLKTFLLSVLLFLNVAHASEQNSFKVSLGNILSGVEFHKITPNTNEEIEPFSGTLKLKYTDFSAPVGPNLNMEVLRSYSSDIYSSEPFPYDRHNQYSLALEGWSFNNGYITVPLTKDCSRDECRPLYVTGSSDRMLLFEDKDRPGQYRTTNHWKSESVSGGGLILISPNGNKHYFQNMQVMTDSVRYYLTKVENIYGDYVLYHYVGPYITKITSSNPDQAIDIKLESLACKIRHNHHYAYGPTIIKYNGKEVARYKHNYIHIGASRHNYSLTNVTLANGKSWSYGYGIVYLHTKDASENYYKNVLHTVAGPEGSTKYYYSADKSLSMSTDVHNLRLTAVKNNNGNGVETGAWGLKFNYGPGNKVVTILNKDFTIVNEYYNYADGGIWRAGLPVSSTIYKNNKVTKDNVIQKESYKWSKVEHNKFKRGYWVFHPYELKHRKWPYKVDDVTYRPLLSEKTIERDGDTYTTKYSDYDDFDNLGTITQTTSNKYSKGSRVIRQDYLNIADKNILGLAETVNVNGKNIQKNSYNEYGNPIYSNELGIEKKYIYSNGLLQSVTDGLGNKTSYSDYKITTPQKIEYSDGTIETQQVNSQGLVTSHKDAKGAVTKTSYDVLGRITEQTPAKGSSKIYSYPSASIVQMHNDDYSESITTSSHGLPVKKSWGINKHIFYKYDAYGRKIFESFPTSNSSEVENGTTFTYDAIDRATSICSGLRKDSSNCVYYKYLPDNTTKITNSNGEYKIVTRLSYNNPSSGDVVSIKEFDRVTNIERDELGAVYSVSQGNSDKQVTKTYKYDKNYNLIQYTEPESGITEYKYDEVGKVVLERKAGQTVEYDYDPKNYNLLGKFYSDNSEDEFFQYDKNNNIILSNKGRISWSYDYDINNRLIDETLKVDGINTKSNDDDKSLYLSTEYKYNSKGDLSSIRYPDNTFLNMNPNEYGYPKKLGDYINNISYHNNGHWSSFRFGNGISANTTLDNLNRVNSYNYGSFNLNYDYDSNNNLINLKLRDIQNKDYNYDMKFGYDLLGRLYSADEPWGVTKYNYDSNDNIVKIRTKPNSNKSVFLDNDKDISFYYDDKLHLKRVAGSNNNLNTTANYFYDYLGNVKDDNKHKYLYGIDGNLLTVSGEHSSYYEYDINHNRVLKQENNIAGNNKTITFYSKSGNALYDYDIKTKKTNKYIYFNGNKIAKVEGEFGENKNQQSKISYYYNDSIGSPIAMADSQGNTIWRELYQPFGTRSIKNNQANNSNKHWFAGKEVDNTSLSYFGARFYNSKSGRFMAADPVAMDPNKPYTFNRYVYANNNPYKYVDPDGKFFLVAVGIGITAYDTYHAYQTGGISSAAKHLVTTGAMTAVTGGAFKLAGKGISYAKVMLKTVKTPYGIAKQSSNRIAIAAREKVANGKSIYRQGEFNMQETHNAQFWAPENPIGAKGFAEKYGTAGSNDIDWVMKADVKNKDFITRYAPGYKNNPGGSLEVVTNPGDVTIRWFHMK